MHWFFQTDRGLLTRILIGIAIFTALALKDLYQNSRAATRWREYLVLLIAIVTALFYGAINDQITVTISPEYFLYGKELFRTIGDTPPPAQLRIEAAKIGLKATWTAGLIFGVVLLLANNPYRNWPRLPNRKLLMYLPIILLTAATLGIVGGFLGYHGTLARLDSDFDYMVSANVYHPYCFMSAWGVHLGGYAGGLIGTIFAAILVLIQRYKKQKGVHHAI